MLSCDSREPDVIIAGLRATGVPITREQRAVGDYAFDDQDGLPCLITRKAADLGDSLFSGHFGEEIQHCITFLKSSGGGHLWWLQEGAWRASQDGSLKGISHTCPPSNRHSTGVDKTHDAIYTLIPNLQISLQAGGVYYITTASLWESTTTIAALYHRGKAGWPTGLPLRMDRPTLHWHRDDEWRHTARLMALWPRLSERLAADLLAQHGSIVNIIKAVENNTLTCPGIGTKMLASLKSVVL